MPLGVDQSIGRYTEVDKLAKSPVSETGVFAGSKPALRASPVAPDWTGTGLLSRE